MLINKGILYPMGVRKINKKICFAVENEAENDCGIILYTRKEEIKIPFAKEQKCGDVFWGEILNDKEVVSYSLYQGKKRYLDVYAEQVTGNEIYGKLECTEQREILRGSLLEDVFDWKDDRKPQTSYEESIIYLLHVRGFTKHASSKVKNRGTFQGIIEKIPYLKELGITAIELMPCYEFLEALDETTEYSAVYRKERKEETRINYWGYKKGFYFSPKASYAAGSNAVTEMKEMIYELHKNGIEVIMQFYFPKEIYQGFIIEVLRHWVFQYHIDGIHLLGESIPIQTIARDPFLCDIKLFFLEYDMDGGMSLKNNKPAVYQDEFMYVIRKFLKGDEDMLTSFLHVMRRDTNAYGVINYITNYCGFTLYDLVSFDRKHNEDNGEDNKDGNDYNFSWNCGIEGETRKKAVQQLRSKQLKNAMMFLLLAQGTPMILSGDEFLNTQYGNNNTYCQDNETGWLNWSKRKASVEFFEFVKELIAIRKKYFDVWRTDTPNNIDTMAGGYPDFSYHGKEAWKPAMENYNRHVGILHSSKEEFFYMVFNMHWEMHEFALPKLPAGYEWKLFADTLAEHVFLAANSMDNQQQVKVQERSIQIYIGVKKEKL